VLYRCETWSLLVKEKHSLRALHSRVLKIFGPEREEAVGGHRKLHNLELVFGTAHQMSSALENYTG
jgi:hypothetical protein